MNLIKELMLMEAGLKTEEQLSARLSKSLDNHVIFRDQAVGMIVTKGDQIELRLWVDDIGNIFDAVGDKAISAVKDMFTSSNPSGTELRLTASKEEVLKVLMTLQSTLKLPVSIGDHTT